MTDRQHRPQAVPAPACPEKVAALLLPPYLLALIANAGTAAGQLLAMPTTAPDWLKACHRRQALAEELAHAVTTLAILDNPPRPVPTGYATLPASPRLLVLIAAAGAAFRRLLDMRATDPQWSERYQHWQALATELAQVVNQMAPAVCIEQRQQLAQGAEGCPGLGLPCSGVPAADAGGGA